LEGNFKYMHKKECVMPQVDMKYSDDLDIDTKKLFQEIESMMNGMDHTAGVCKSRAYPTSEYMHSHCYVRVSVLRKPHRDQNFMQNCFEQLNSLVGSAVPDGAYYSVELAFSGNYYFTVKKES
ncbi:MAG: hypothetical protein MRY83_16835, partial [Flavobacteriales bacterium]|nr:hypothetical protein [Flavobacteriales bacterium]